MTLNGSGRRVFLPCMAELSGLPCYRVLSLRDSTVLKLDFNQFLDTILLGKSALTLSVTDPPSSFQYYHLFMQKFSMFRFSCF